MDGLRSFCMVKENKIFTLFRLVRTANLLIIAFTLYVVRYFVVKPYLNHHNLELQFSDKHFFLLVAATILIAAGGYVINDYFDRKTDFLNKPDKVIVGKKIKRRYAMLLHLLLNAAGIACGLYISFYIGYPIIGLIFPLIAGILWFYSTTYKRQLFVGNIIVAMLTGLVPLMVILFEIPLLNQIYGKRIILMNISFKYIIAWSMALAGFAFIMNLIREIIKDTEDFEGDAAFGRDSIPIVFGIRWTKTIIISLTVVTLLLILYISLNYFILRLQPTNMLLPILYVFLLIVSPLVFMIYLINDADEKKDYTRASLITKLVMLFGILFTFFVKSYFVT